MKKTSKFFERLAFAADLPDEPMPGLPLVEIAGDRRVLIENHYGVCEYGDRQISVKVKFGIICVNGCNLILSRMTKGQLIISGHIESLMLRREGK